MRKWFVFLIISALLLPLPSCASKSSLFGEYTKESTEETQDEEIAATVVFSQNRYIFTGDTDAIASEDCSFYIVKGGAYKLSGKLTDGNIIIDAEGESVKLVLCGLEIYCDTLTPIQINIAAEVIIETEVNTKNVIECNNKTQTAISSQTKITILNQGALSVNGLALGENKT